jgi:hypothetical protein
MVNYVPRESPYPGFFLSERFPEVAGSLDGRLVKLAKYQLGKITRGTPFNTGYLGFKTYDAVRKKDRTVLVHHIIMDVFNPNGKFESAEVNHKDGDKQNNSYCNLEWVSHSANVRHSITDLGYTHRTLRPVEVKDLLDGTVHAFDTIVDAERTLSIKRGRIKAAIGTTLKCVDGRYLVRDANPSEPWPNVTYGVLTKNRSIGVVDVATGTKTIYQTIAAAVLNSGCSKYLARKAIDNEYNGVVNGKWLFDPRLPLPSDEKVKRDTSLYRCRSK